MLLNQEEIDSLQSLPASTLDQVLGEFTKKDRAAIERQLTPATINELHQHVQSMQLSEREKARRRMAERRAKERDLVIPCPKNVKRRIKALADPEYYLRTYLADVFFEPFTRDRSAMVESMVRSADYASDDAIAGPRGEGKSRLAMYTSVWLMKSKRSPRPVVIGKNQKRASRDLRAVRDQIQQNRMIRDDFPELAIPFRAVGAWSSRAAMQTVGGRLSRLEFDPTYFIFPTIYRFMLPDDWPDDSDPITDGQWFASLGRDGAVRGFTLRDQRPTAAIIDDLEDKKSAKSDTLIKENEDFIESDVGGLGGDRRISRVMLCTTQNRKCIAFRYTDPTQKPSWSGRRYSKLIRKPDREDLWREYVELRAMRAIDDPEARVAHRFYRDHKEIMDSPGVAECISNPYRYSKELHEDGEPLELSALERYYNSVADFGEKSVATEQNQNPPEELGPQGTGLTAAIVASRVSGLARLQVPASTTKLAMGIDIGKYRLHHVTGGWSPGALGTICDYGKREVVGNTSEMSSKAAEPAIYQTLIQYREELLKRKIVDAAGHNRTLDAVFIDSGTYTEAVYRFVREVGAPFYATKGVGKYKEKSESDTVLPNYHQHAHHLLDKGVWLYLLDTDWWKSWVQERFLSPTFDEDQQLRLAALSLFKPPSKNQRHLSYGEHIVAEELVKEFVPEKGEIEKWVIHDSENHLLDATYLMSAAGGMLGIRTMQGIQTVAPPPDLEAAAQAATREQQRRPSKPRSRKQNRYKQRNGGWVPRR